MSLIIFFGLVISIPLYTDAVYQRIFLEKMMGQTTRDSGLPFLYRFRYYGLWSGKSQWENVEPLDSYIMNASSQVLDIPLLRSTRLFFTDFFDFKQYVSDTSENNQEEDIHEKKELDSAKAISYSDENLGVIKFAYVSKIEDQIEIVDGQFPGVEITSQNEPIDVLVSLDLANQAGFQAGEVYALNSINRSKKDKVYQFLVRIAGIWQPKDPEASFWTFDSSSLDEVFLVNENNFFKRISPGYHRELTEAIWYIILDGTQINSDEVSGLIDRMNAFEKTASSFYRSFHISPSPKNELIEFQQSAEKLRLSIYSYALPIYGLMLAFILMVSNLSIEGRRNEIAVTRSRGATIGQVVGMIGIEYFLLCGFALIPGFFMAKWIASVIGLSNSFMDFSSRALLDINWSKTAFQAGLIAFLVIWLLTLIPAIKFSRDTIVSYKKDRARQIKPPVWQRLWLDFLLLIPAGYGTYILSRQGSLFPTSQTIPNGTTDPLSDPLLFLVPSLSVLALSLLSVRGLHYILEGISWLISHTKSTGLILAVRQLARTRTYQAPLLILIFTLSLSIYTASLAQTIDQHLINRVFYEVGSEANFTKVGQEQLPGINMGTSSENKDDSLSFPVNEFLKIPGIEKAVRVGNYPAYASMVIGGVEKGRFIGVDRIEFPSAAYWRTDFADFPLGHLMNLLASSPEGILASREFLQDNGLNPGDPLELRIATDLGRVVMIGTIVGSFDLFPTWYSEEDGPLFIGNLETVFDLSGGFTNYQVWVKTDSSFDYNSIQHIVLPGLGVKVLSWKSSPPRIASIQGRPEQQGVFGFLMIGFACAALFTVAGLFMYTFFSYRQRYIELGVLRAIGLNSKQMGFSLAIELFFLLIIGGVIGTILGLWSSNLYIPFLQIGQKPFERIPPFEVVIGWSSIVQIYVLFIILVVFVLFLLISALRRMKIFQAIKLGETL